MAINSSYYFNLMEEMKREYEEYEKRATPISFTTSTNYTILQNEAVLLDNVMNQTMERMREAFHQERVMGRWNYGCDFASTYGSQCSPTPTPMPMPKHLNKLKLLYWSYFQKHGEKPY
jgi:hypothetical protein